MLAQVHSLQIVLLELRLKLEAQLHKRISGAIAPFSEGITVFFGSFLCISFGIIATDDVVERISAFEWLPVSDVTARNHFWGISQCSSAHQVMQSRGLVALQ